MSPLTFSADQQNQIWFKSFSSSEVEYQDRHHL